MLLMSDVFSSVLVWKSRLCSCRLRLISNANISSRLPFKLTTLERSSSWNVVCLEAKAKAAGLNVGFLRSVCASFQEQIRKSHIWGYSWTMSGRDSPLR